MEYHRPGPGGLPLSLRLSEGLGLTALMLWIEFLRVNDEMVWVC